jgi:biopolymer transport protein TolR
MGASLPSGGGRRAGRDRGTMSEINVTPFVDVMLVLLIIFMVTAPMMTAGVTVDLPDSKAPAVPGTDEPLTVSVSKKGTIYLQETEIEIKDLVTKLEAIAGEKKDTRIFVRGDQGIHYGLVMQVVGEMSAAGFNKVALITEPSK